jgi:hypothetical protein
MFFRKGSMLFTHTVVTHIIRGKKNGSKQYNLYSTTPWFNIAFFGVFSLTVRYPNLGKVQYIRYVTSPVKSVYVVHHVYTRMQCTYTTGKEYVTYKNIYVILGFLNYATFVILRAVLVILYRLE